MKIYFSSSLRGKSDYGKYYKRVVDFIHESGNSLVVDTTSLSNPSKVAQETEEDARNWYNKMLSWIDKSHIAIFEVSRPSLGIGHEITIALTKGKPVIALHVEGNRPYVIESIPSDKVQVVSYNNKNLETELAHALDYAKGQLDQRFTMIMPSDIMTHLNTIASSGKSRSEYIRNLILEDMSKRES